MEREQSLPRRLNTGFNSKFPIDFTDRHTVDEGRRAQRPKHWANNNKDGDNNSHVNNANNDNSSSQKFRKNSLYSSNVEFNIFLPLRCIENLCPALLGVISLKKKNNSRNTKYNSNKNGHESNLCTRTFRWEKETLPSFSRVILNFIWCWNLFILNPAVNRMGGC